MTEAVVYFASEPVAFPYRRQFVDLSRVLAKLAICFANFSDQPFDLCPGLPFVDSDAREHDNKNNPGQENHSDDQRRNGPTPPPNRSDHHHKYSYTHQRRPTSTQKHYTLTG